MPDNQITRTKTAREVLQMAVEHAERERMNPNYVPPGGVQYVTIPAWVAKELLDAR